MYRCEDRWDAIGCSSYIILHRNSRDLCQYFCVLLPLMNRVPGVLPNARSGGRRYRGSQRAPFSTPNFRHSTAGARGSAALGSGSRLSALGMDGAVVGSMTAGGDSDLSSSDSGWDEEVELEVNEAAVAWASSRKERVFGHGKCPASSIWCAAPPQAHQDDTFGIRSCRRRHARRLKAQT